MSFKRKRFDRIKTATVSTLRLNATLVPKTLSKIVRKIKAINNLTLKMGLSLILGHPKPFLA